jgi:SOS-response transcriptional repressor LexA
MSVATIARKEDDLYRYICRYVSRFGMGPTYCEMATACGILTPGEVQSRVRGLVRDGLIEARTIRPVRADECARCGAELEADGRCSACVGVCFVCGKPVRRRGESWNKTTHGWRHDRCGRRWR